MQDLKPWVSQSWVSKHPATRISLPPPGSKGFLPPGPREVLRGPREKNGPAKLPAWGSVNWPETETPSSLSGPQPLELPQKLVRAQRKPFATWSQGPHRLWGDLVAAERVLFLSGREPVSLEPEPGAGLEKHWRDKCQGPCPWRGRPPAAH